jgi:hypothetical protein
MVTILTTIYSSLDQFVWYSNGLVIRCLFPAKIDHSKTGLARYSDPHCIKVELDRKGAKMILERVA